MRLNHIFAIFLSHSFHCAISTISVKSLVKIGSSGLTDFDGFGNAISLSQNRFLASQNFKENPPERNVVLVFEYQRKGKLWSETAQLKAEGRTHNLDGYGNKISLERSTALVGAYAGGTASFSQSGYAFIFQATGSKWTQVAKLIPPRVAKDDNFGNAVCLYNHSAWIGAPQKQAVYLYREFDIGWSLFAILTQSHSPNFGCAIASFGHRVVIGASHDSTVSEGAGAAYLYEQSIDGNWEMSTKLLASDMEALDAFGYSVGLFEDTIIVGAPYDDDYGMSSGSAWLFQKSSLNGLWTQSARLIPSDASASDNFGLSVGINSEWAVVSVEPYWTGGTPPGSVYFFSSNSGDQLLDGLRDINDGSARYVSVDANRALVGGPSANEYGRASGVVYVLEMQTDPSSAPTSPSQFPTGIPSSPSRQPTVTPSLEPSGTPSTCPSSIPSTEPTSPTHFPSATPSGDPTAEPSQAPSNPTVCPSTIPSGEPSAIPTDTPTHPTTPPTYAPTHIPSKRPTVTPSIAPSAMPVCPTLSPTTAPTEKYFKQFKTIHSTESSRSELSVGLTVGLFVIAAVVIGAVSGVVVYRSRRAADWEDLERAYEMDIVNEVVNTAY